MAGELVDRWKSNRCVSCEAALSPDVGFTEVWYDNRQGKVTLWYCEVCWCKPGVMDKHNYHSNKHWLPAMVMRGKSEPGGDITAITATLKQFQKELADRHRARRGDAKRF